MEIRRKLNLKDSGRLEGNEASSELSVTLRPDVCVGLSDCRPVVADLEAGGEAGNNRDASRIRLARSCGAVLHRQKGTSS